jgi:hypothetical protein
MKKIVLLTLLAITAGIVLSVGQVKAASYTISGTQGTYDLNIIGSTFTFSGTDIDVQGLGTTDISVTNGFLGTTGNITGGTVTFSNPTFTGFNANGISQDIAAGSSSIGLTGADGSFLSLFSYAPTAYSPTGFTGDVSGGSYTPGTTPAPEASSVVAFGAMLAAGGLLLFAAKRRSSAPIS